MESSTISEIVDVSIAWKTDCAQNIKINTQVYTLNYKPFMWKAFLTWVILTLWSENVFKDRTATTERSVFENSASGEAAEF